MSGNVTEVKEVKRTPGVSPQVERLVNLYQQAGLPDEAFGRFIEIISSEGQGGRGNLDNIFAMLSAGDARSLYSYLERLRPLLAESGLEPPPSVLPAESGSPPSPPQPVQEQDGEETGSAQIIADLRAQLAAEQEGHRQTQRQARSDRGGVTKFEALADQLQSELLETRRQLAEARTRLESSKGVFLANEALRGEVERLNAELARLRQQSPTDFLKALVGRTEP